LPARLLNLCAGSWIGDMADRLSRDHRSWNMSRITGSDTAPEKAVRSALHRLGYRFRLNDRRLPGKPDIVLPRHRTVVFVHGCFWHRHSGCEFAYTPRSRLDFWLDKFAGNVTRDKRNVVRLREAGWRVLVVWECETRDSFLLGEWLKDELTSNAIESKAIDPG
jgi:DNA mismatch endonuclease, patch repair protein